MAGCRVSLPRHIPQYDVDSRADLALPGQPRCRPICDELPRWTEHASCVRHLCRSRHHVVLHIVERPRRVFEPHVRIHFGLLPGASGTRVVPRGALLRGVGLRMRCEFIGARQRRLHGHSQVRPSVLQDGLWDVRGLAVQLLVGLSRADTGGLYLRDLGRHLHERLAHLSVEQRVSEDLQGHVGVRALESREDRCRDDALGAGAQVARVRLKPQVR
mmetsp:Transcript_1973/g.5569  ORF Transcript_1973/g.5569 Transcript_1973/m.5569 type:complete len:216 (+) Transcript_1973:553-1200(+)